MGFGWIILIAIAVISLLVILTSAICYLKVFYSAKRKPRAEDDYDLPPGKEYEPFHPQMIEWTKEARLTPHKKVEIETFDGLTLRGRYYEHSKDAPIEIMMHGYGGNMERDLSGGIFRALKIGHSVLVYNHRGSGESDGHTLTFGINESRDCRRWIDYVINNINKDAKIIISGVSMGGATAMIVSGFDDLPKNVVGVVADCGYTSAKDIIKKVIRDMKLPPNLLYPFVKLGALLFGRFHLDETSPIEAIARISVPVILYHGEEDFLVPCDHSRRLAAAAASPCRLVTVKGADHALAYGLDPEAYVAALRAFLAECEPIAAE